MKNRRAQDFIPSQFLWKEIKEAKQKLMVQEAKASELSKCTFQPNKDKRKRDGSITSNSSDDSDHRKVGTQDWIDAWWDKNVKFLDMK